MKRYTIYTAGKKRTNIEKFRFKMFSALSLKNPPLSTWSSNDRAREWVKKHNNLAEKAQEILSKVGEDTTFGVYCFGGRHRSPALAESIRDILTSQGHEVTIVTL